MTSKNGLQSLHSMIEYIWDRDLINDDKQNDFVVLGNTYPHPKEQKRAETGPASPHKEQGNNDATVANDITQPDIKQHENNSTIPDILQKAHFNDIKNFFHKKVNYAEIDIDNVASKEHQDQPNQWPKEFIKDVETRVWLTYRSGFPLIKKSEHGPSPLNFGSLIRGTIDLSTMTKGFTTDAGWGCMIRTSQSLLANALINLHIGREWRYSPEDDATATDGEVVAKYAKHCEIISWFVDVPSACFSIHNFVEKGFTCSNKKPGEWFGPSAAARSIQELCEDSYKKCKLKVYLTSSGDLFESEILQLSKETDEGDSFDQLNESNDETHFNPILILAGIRLGVKNVNPLYWEFLKKTLNLPQSVGIAGGRPSSSHYFFGYQDDYLFYLDPHVPQKALLTASDQSHSQELPLDSSNYIEVESQLDIPSVHTKKIRKLHLDQMDPSMLLGLLIKNKEDYLDLKKSIDEFDPNRKFLNFFSNRPALVTSKSLSAGGETLDDSEFIDLGVESMNEYDCAIEDEDDFPEENGNTEDKTKHERAFSQPVMVSKDETFGFSGLGEEQHPSETGGVLSSSEIEFDRDASMIENSEVNETFEEIHKSETASQLEAEEPVVVDVYDNEDEDGSDV